MTNTTPARLFWTRHRSGSYGAAAPINGEADAFEAFAVKGLRAPGHPAEWCVSLYTYDRTLERAKWVHTLAEAKAHAQAAYDAVESVNL